MDFSALEHDFPACRAPAPSRSIFSGVRFARGERPSGGTSREAPYRSNPPARCFTRLRQQRRLPPSFRAIGLICARRSSSRIFRIMTATAFQSWAVDSGCWFSVVPVLLLQPISNRMPRMPAVPPAAPDSLRAAMPGGSRRASRPTCWIRAGAPRPAGPCPP